ncbi:MAG: hypothetical protein ACK5E6_02625 [Cyanobacteriota bacterium]|jgi:hypothetical protein
MQTTSPGGHPVAGLLREIGNGSRFFALVLLSLPLSAMPMGEIQALNRELGKLCSNPPPKALTVCRIHARLVRML